jgi:hypothetical protein
MVCDLFSLDRPEPVQYNVCFRHKCSPIPAHLHYLQGATGGGNEAALLQAAGAAVARTRSKDELASLLTDLHEALTEQVG